MIFNGEGGSHVRLGNRGIKIKRAELSPRVRRRPSRPRPLTHGEPPHPKKPLPSPNPPLDFFFLISLPVCEKLSLSTSAKLVSRLETLAVSQTPSYDYLRWAASFSRPTIHPLSSLASGCRLIYYFSSGELYTIEHGLSVSTTFLNALNRVFS